MKFLIILSSLLLSSIYCEDTYPDYVLKGLEAMENPQIPYSKFLDAQEYLKGKGQDIKFEHLETYTRPEKSFYSSGIYNSKRLKYYSYFAAFGYCYPESIENGECCTNWFKKEKGVTSPNGWILVNYGRSANVDTHNIYTHNKNTYAIFRSDIFKKVVITFPGTKDQIIQLGAELINSNLVKPAMKKFSGDIKINKYFDARASALCDFIFSQTNRGLMKISEGYQVIFTGHSLGGAMATASLFFAIDRGYISSKNKPVIITYGQPRTGNEAFALAVNNNAEVIYRNVNSMDIVTQIPLYGDGYRHTVGEIYINGDKNSYSIDKKMDAYNVNTVVDSQKYDILVLMKYLINNLDRHTNYYAKQISGTCG